MSEHARVVLVTGAAAGIGHACVARFAARGDEVVGVDRDAPATPVPGVTYHRVDVTDAAAIASLVDQVRDVHGGLDVLVNCAGISYVGGVEDGTDAEWLHLWDVNVMGYVRMIRGFLPALRESRSAAIVNVSSCTAVSGFRQRAAYSATKGAVEALTRSVAADLVAEGITVNAVQPGTVSTPFMEELAARAEDSGATWRAYSDRQPTGRMVTPEEVAAAVAYLADPLSRSAVGAVLVVDGGIANLHITQA